MGANRIPDQNNQEQLLEYAVQTGTASDGTKMGATAVSLAGSYWPQSQVLFEDTFHDGLDGWTWLMDNVSPVVGPTWTSRRTFRGTGSMLLETGDVIRMDASGAGLATTIKRLTLPMAADGSFAPLIESEYWYGWSANDQNNPAIIQFGLDTQRPDITGYRSYFKLRFENYDETAVARTGKWKVSTPAGYVDVPGAGGFSYFNEAKGGFFHLRFRVNIVTGFYDSLWLNGKKFDLRSFQCAQDGYVNNAGGTFDYGMNFSVDLWNRLNTSAGVKRHARLYVPYARGAVVS